MSSILDDSISIIHFAACASTWGEPNETRRDVRRLYCGKSASLASTSHGKDCARRRPDILALDGDDLRRLPLSLRKTNLARLLARRPDGIFVAPFEQGEIEPDLFRAVCGTGLEGLVSKRRDRPYQGGRSKYWVKVKNPKHPAMSRVMEAFS